MITVREACECDAESIHLLNELEMKYEYSLERTKLKIQKILSLPTDRIFVAEVDGKVAGYVHANDYDVLYFPHMKNIMGIAVGSEYKRHGVGRALLEAVEKWARETGALGIRLVSGSSRIEAHKFYSSCGFECGKTQLNFKKKF